MRPLMLNLPAGHCIRLLVCILLLSGCSGVPQHAPLSENEAPAEASKVPSAVAGKDDSPSASADAAVDTVAEENIIYFASGATTVDLAGEAKLRLHAEYLKENPKKILTIAGHTDDLGSINYNLAIAEERMTNVGKLLKAYGAPPRQVRRNRAGNGKKPEICKTAECRQRMRRVELNYLP
ncbi:OmpA family protein [Propionivibrio sp.]|uniref:OmpA family protein n=1 Tax=Propionivibrio sp. TaxID=2212460 RepID=UPI0025F5C69E|nr:OmpA family protein [Propionivibrio sp.]MBK8743901.1 OmpA family protein [Propionivibrio sp.]